MNIKDAERPTQHEQKSHLTQDQRALVNVLKNVELSTAMEIVPPWMQPLLKLEMNRRISEESLEDIYKAAKIIAEALRYLGMSNFLSQVQFEQYLETVENSIEIELVELESENQEDQDEGVDNGISSDYVDEDPEKYEVQEDFPDEEISWEDYISFQLMRLQYNLIIFEGMISNFEEMLIKQTLSVETYVQKLSNDVLSALKEVLSQSHLQKAFSLTNKNYSPSDLFIQ